MEGYHKSVLVGEIIDALNPTCLSAGRDAWVLDATLGDGGHSIEILKREGKIVGIDVDPQALDRVRQRFKSLKIAEDRYKLVLGNFRDLKNLIAPASPAKRGEQAEPKFRFKGVLFDLGVSSLQLETPQRGFSFSREGPLDMRMDPNLGVRALDLINALNKGELNELFSKLGEEKYSKKLADALVSARSVKKIESTKQLADLIEKNVGRSGNIHPATKVFQALRIAVNDELGAIEEALPQSLDILISGGLVLVISFHSLEDRIVKDTFKNWQEVGKGKVINEKPIVPSQEEVTNNPRSRSARLRIFRKL